jgi:hypothetical protein
MLGHPLRLANRDGDGRGIGRLRHFAADASAVMTARSRWLTTPSGM